MDVDVCRFFPVGQWQSNYHIIYYSTYLLLSEHGFGDSCQTAYSAAFKFKSNE